MPNFTRLLRHLAMTRWQLQRAFPTRTLNAIEQAITNTEREHGGEIRFAVEAELSTAELLRDVAPRERALAVFGELGVWDTEHNNGVLIYILLADHDVEIVADRGFTGKVSAAEWTEVCTAMEAAFGRGDFRTGSLVGIAAIGKLIAQHFPATDRNEQPNRAVML